MLTCVSQNVFEAVEAFAAEPLNQVMHAGALDVIQKEQDNKISDKEMSAGDVPEECCDKFELGVIADEFNVKTIGAGGMCGVKELCEGLIKEMELESTFYVLDLGNLERLYDAWHEALPRVTPHFAVKACPQPAIIAYLAARGCGFDCASPNEIELVRKAGVSTDRIIYAHPSKSPREIRYAAENNVRVSTFDSIVEIEKIAKWHKDSQVVMRIRADDPGAKIPFGVKYGAEQCEFEILLSKAKDLDVNVIGVSFHVGSLSSNPSAYWVAIGKAREAFDIATKIGHKMELLDIGGGFVGRFDENGQVSSMKGDVPLVINRAIDEYFGEDGPYPHTKVISEPGRYFCEATMHLACIVNSYRRRKDLNGQSYSDYIISDGLYGSFNGVVYDGARPKSFVLKNPISTAQEDVEDSTVLEKSNIFGPTCDSMDCVYKGVEIPRLMVGDWLIFPHFGAYSIAGACNFNGIMAAEPDIFHVQSNTSVDLLENEMDNLHWCLMNKNPSDIVA